MTYQTPKDQTFKSRFDKRVLESPDLALGVHIFANVQALLLFLQEKHSYRLSHTGMSGWNFQEL